jgi:antitoxin YefM
MEALFYSAARNNLRTLIDRTIDDCEAFLITTKDSKSAVLVSYEEYQSMKETLYLLSSKNNRDRLLDAVEQIQQGQFKPQTLLS